MEHPLLKSSLALSVLLAACGCTSIAPSAVDRRAELLTLHEEVMRAHRESDAELILRTEASEYISANRGQVTRPTLDARRVRLQNYLRITRFTEYVDVVPPIVRVSSDGSLGWVVVQVRATGVQTTEDDGLQPLSFESAWVELYERRAGTWFRVGNASNFKP